MISKARLFVVSVVSAALVGCGGDADNADGFDLDSAPELTLAEDLRIGNAEDPDLGFSSLRGVEVDRDGNIYAGEGREREIRVFDPRGQLIRRIGRPGSGPGEFEQLPSFGFAGDTLWTIEGSRRLITLFTREGDVIGTGIFEQVRVPLPPPDRGFAIVRPVALRTDGTFISEMVGTEWRVTDPPSDLKEGDTLRVPRVRFDATGKIIDTVGWDIGPPFVTSDPAQLTIGGQRYYLPSPPSIPVKSVGLPDGRALFDVPTAGAAGDGRFDITRVSLAGDTVQRTTYRYTALRFPDELLDSLAWRSARTPGGGVRMVGGVPQRPTLGSDSTDVYRQIRGAMAFPSFQAPLQSYFLNRDAELWLRRENADGARQRWLVLGPDDGVRGMVTIPADARIAWARGDAVVLIELDDDGIPWLVRYRIGQ